MILFLTFIVSFIWYLALSRYTLTIHICKDAKYLKKNTYYSRQRTSLPWLPPVKKKQKKVIQKGARKEQSLRSFAKVCYSSRTMVANTMTYYAIDNPDLCLSLSLLLFLSLHDLFIYACLLTCFGSIIQLMYLPRTDTPRKYLK